MNLGLGLGNSNKKDLEQKLNTNNNETVGNISEIDTSKVEMGTPLKWKPKEIASGDPDKPVPFSASPDENEGEPSVSARSPSRIETERTSVPLHSSDERISLNSGDSKLYSNILAVDKDTKIIKKFFHDLLLYINRTNSTLKNDIDGEVENFINQIPPNELNMNFQNWILDKVANVKADFRKSVQKKLSLVSKSIDIQKQYIDGLATDEELIEIYKCLEN